MKNVTETLYGTTYLTQSACLIAENDERITKYHIENYLDEVEGTLTDRTYEVISIESKEGKSHWDKELEEIEPCENVADFLNSLEPILEKNHIVKIEFYFEIEWEIEG